jgi:hypothetical protein
MGMLPVVGVCVRVVRVAMVMGAPWVVHRPASLYDYISIASWRVVVWSAARSFRLGCGGSSRVEGEEGADGLGGCICTPRRTRRRSTGLNRRRQVDSILKAIFPTISSRCGMKSEKTPLRFCNFVAGPAWRGIWADSGVLLPSGAARKGDFSSNLKVSTWAPLHPQST